MPQVFQVLRCFKCMVFQVHQTKKSNKFQCKMCGEKQSIKRHYGLGNGQECRKHVQKLNGIRGELEGSQNISDDCSEDEIEEEELVGIPIPNKTQKKMNSKWAGYVDTEEAKDTSQLNDETMYLNDAEVVLELPQKRRKIVGCQNKNRLDTESQADAKTKQDIFSKTRKSYSGNQQSKSNLNVVLNNGQPKETNIFPVIVTQEHSFSKYNANVFQKLSTEIEANTKNLKSSIQSEMHKHKQVKLDKVNKVIPPIFNKNSKWAKFAEENECEKYEEDTLWVNDKTNPTEQPLSGEFSNKHAQGKSLKRKSETDAKTLFSLCDDSDLDDYLAI